MGILRGVFPLQLNLGNWWFQRNLVHETWDLFLVLYTDVCFTWELQGLPRQQKSCPISRNNLNRLIWIYRNFESFGHLNLNLIRKTSNLVVSVISPPVTKAGFCNCKKTVHPAINLFYWVLELSYFLGTIKCGRTIL